MSAAFLRMWLHPEINFLTKWRRYAVALARSAWPRSLVKQHLGDEHEYVNGALLNSVIHRDVLFRK
jgi:hypothetical protein